MNDVPHAVVTEDDGIITVTLNRPEKLNPISLTARNILWDAVNALGDRDDLRVMIITATGRYFTAGADLKEMIPEGMPGPDGPGHRYRRVYRSLHLLYDEMENVEKPIIIAANGPCIGSGTEMAVSCDFRFCTPEAHWGVPEVRTLGTIAGSGGTGRLTRLVGTHWAKWIAMAAQNVSAEDARMMGLVHEIVPAERLMDRVHEFAREVIEIDPEAVAMAKLVIDAVDPHDREKSRQIERLGTTPLSHMGAGKPVPTAKR
jgi:enoyl-CoA hydratase/carnithine racemase